MVLEFDHFHQLAIGTESREYETLLGEGGTEVVIEFITMTMAFTYRAFTIRFIRLTAEQQFARVLPQPHCATQVFYLLLLAHHADDR